jgi:hypothetical protein
MKDEHTDNLLARFERNAPDVDADGDWATVEARIVKSGRKRSRRGKSRLLIPVAAMCIVGVVVVATVLVLSGAGRNHSAILFTDSSTVAPQSGTSTTATTVANESTVTADSLSAAWLKLADTLGFDVAHAQSDELDVDYTPAGELSQVYIHAYVFIPGKAGIGLLTIRSQAVSPHIELSATLAWSDASGEYGTESASVVSILSAIDAANASEPATTSLAKEMISKFTGTSSDTSALYRLTTAWDLSKRDAIDSKETAFVWRSASASLELLSPTDSLRGASLPAYLHLVMLASRWKTAPGITTDGATTDSLPRIYFVLPAADTGASNHQSSSTTMNGAGTDETTPVTDVQTTTTAGSDTTSTVVDTSSSTDTTAVTTQQ